MDKITVQQKRFIDAKGRHVILNGINMVYKGELVCGKMNYIPPWNEEDFKLLRDWGFNVVRLGLIWDAVEPEPGVYNEAYLDWIESMLDLCARYGIYAFLDMHQDLYSMRYSDGAPESATLTDGLPHAEGELWSDAYLFSEAVQRAFDHFWANSPVSSGKGLQEHYRDMWLHIVPRFKDHPALLGYDFLNEPFPGTKGRDIFGALLAVFADQIGSQEDLLEVFTDPSKKLGLLALLENEDLYHTLARSVEPMLAEFDQGVLAEFYQNLTQAVRQLDSQGIIMREHSYFSNMGIQCKAPLIMAGPNQVDPNQAYSPHGYDLVVDTDAIIMASNKRIDVIFGTHKRTQDSLNVPVLVGSGEHIDTTRLALVILNTYCRFLKEISGATPIGTMKITFRLL